MVAIVKIYFDNVSLTGIWTSYIASTFETITVILFPYWKFVSRYIAIINALNDVANTVVK